MRLKRELPSELCTREGEPLIDFVGHYESLQTDFDTICARLGLSKRVLPQVNMSKSACIAITS